MNSKHVEVLQYIARLWLDIVFRKQALVMSMRNGEEEGEDINPGAKMVIASIIIVPRRNAQVASWLVASCSCSNTTPVLGSGTLGYGGRIAALSLKEIGCLIRIITVFPVQAVELDSDRRRCTMVIPCKCMAHGLQERQLPVCSSRRLTE